MSTRKFIYRILALLKRLNVLKNIYEISYNGKIFSLNDLYRQGHWSIRSNLKKKYSELFLAEIVKTDLKFINQFYLIVFYNTRHDPDNIVGVVKVMVDTLKGTYIVDDNKKYFRGVSIFPDEDLPPGTVEFLIAEKV